MRFVIIMLLLAFSHFDVGAMQNLDDQEHSLQGLPPEIIFKIIKKSFSNFNDGQQLINDLKKFSSFFSASSTLYQYKSYILDILKKHATINALSEALEIAINENKNEIVKLLINVVGNKLELLLLHKYSLGLSPLHLAIKQKNMGIITTIFDKVKDNIPLLTKILEVQNEHGYTPLMGAVQLQDYEIVKKILEEGSKTNQYFLTLKDTANESVLEIAKEDLYGPPDSRIIKLIEDSLNKK